ncbi:mCG148443 [Mus musculus]|nr:mCG148443 [Mus musculus]
MLSDLNCIVGHPAGHRRLMNVKNLHLATKESRVGKPREQKQAWGLLPLKTLGWCSLETCAGATSVRRP